MSLIAGCKTALVGNDPQQVSNNKISTNAVIVCGEDEDSSESAGAVVMSLTGKTNLVGNDCCQVSNEKKSTNAV